MKTVRLGITEYMDCAHFLPGHNKCGSLHGHTYKVEVIVEGEVKSGMLIDFADLKDQVREVLAAYDHRALNDVMEYPSVENICNRLGEDLKARLAFPLLVRVWEGQGKWAEIQL
ncbi:MAG: 6-carboxytetrahydropterin synthase [Thermoplasmata archaeon]